MLNNGRSPSSIAWEQNSLFPVTGDGEEPLFTHEPATKCDLSLLGKKVVPRTNSIRPFMANGVFLFYQRLL